jgi:ABC-2 type transport system permease protein
VIVAAGVGGGNALFGLGMSSANVWAATVHAILLGVMFAALTTLVSALIGRRLATMLVVAAVAGVAYLVATFFPLIEALADWARVSPWHYYYESNPLATGVDWGNVGVMAAIAAVTYTAAWYVYSKRDLPG